MVYRAQILLFVFSALVLAGCGGKTNPVSPTPTPTLGSASPVSMTIGGTTSLVHPGDTAQLNATVTFSDNTSRDVTAAASWRGSGAVAIVAPGLITATRYGDGSFSASYLSVSRGSLVRVLPAGAFLVDGLVSAQGTFFPGLARASVELSSRSGTYRATSSESGWFFLPAAGETTIRVERDGFHPQVKQMTVEHDESVDFELQPTDTPDDVRILPMLDTASTSS